MLKYFKVIVFLTILFLILSPTKEITNPANLAKIELSGPIMDSSKIVDKLQKAQNDTNIKGVLFVIDSPGGAVAPSVEIAYAIKELKHFKPVIVAHSR